MRRVGNVAHYAARMCKYRNLQLSTCCYLSRVGIRAHATSSETPELNDMSKKIISSRVADAAAPRIEIPDAKVEKKAGHIASLYDALVYSGDSRRQGRMWRECMGIDASGNSIPEHLNEQVKKDLENAKGFCDAEDALRVLHGVERDGYLPSARAVVMGIEACVPAGEFEMAERALGMLDAVEVQHPTRSERLRCSARTFMAMTYTSRGRYEDALRVMGMPSLGVIRAGGSEGLQRAVEKIGLGTESLSWGVLVKALTKIGEATYAVNVMDIAVKSGVGMTDSLLHLTIDALRKVDRWKEAAWLFDSAVEKGVKPSEMTLASVLLALTSRVARVQIEAGKIGKIIDLADSPSPRFLVTSLMALTAVGEVRRSEEVFEKLGSLQRDGVAEQDCFGLMMAGYGNYIDLLSAEKRDAKGKGNVYVEVNEKADALWKEFLSHYRLQRPSGMLKNGHSGMLAKYVRVKVRCFKMSDAISVLQHVGYNQKEYPWLEVRMQHITATLGAVELSSNVKQMKRLLEMIQDLKLQHDIRSLAFCIGTYVGDGDLSNALALSRQTATLLDANCVHKGYREHHPMLLLRRLQTLAAALRDAGGKPDKELSDIMRRLERIVNR